MHNAKDEKHTGKGVLLFKTFCFCTGSFSHFFVWFVCKIPLSDWEMLTMTVLSEFREFTHVII
jgi:hypothetical protein